MKRREGYAVDDTKPISLTRPKSDTRVIRSASQSSQTGSLRATCLLSLSLAVCLTLANGAHAGTWSPLANQAPAGIGTMLLLSDGTVMAEGASGAGTNTWYRLTPNIKGSYLSGTWTTLASMHDTRLYFSSDVLPNGQLYVAGAEDGTGGSSAEVYNPANNTWTYAPASGVGFSDAISTTLPNGNVLDGPVSPNPSGSTLIYNYLSNTWTTGPSYVRGGYQDEASWVKLADGSILTIDPFGQNSERFIPSLNQWVNDSNVPVPMYNSTLGELGAAFLLPNGQAFYLGGTGNTAIYTPSGNTNPGTWSAGPVIPNGLAAEDAPAAMESNGLILCACGPNSSYNGPTTFFEYNYVTNSFTQVGAPGGSEGNPTFVERMLDLPDGTVLYTNGGSQLYEYAPSGGQLASGVPTVTHILKNQDGSYDVQGYQLTGISEGAAYGDDAQMASNYPIMRLVDSSLNVYIGKSYNWNTTSVMQGLNLESAQFTAPSGLPSGALTLQVDTNGICSNLMPFSTATIYNYIVTENQSYTFTIPVDLAYGAAGLYDYSLARSGPITFSNTAWGNDPNPGVAKFGFYKPYTQCAAENGSFTFTVPVDAAYGANGLYYNNWGVSGTVTFSNAAWGGDPDPNVVKAGYYTPYTYSVPENGTVTFTTPTDIAYGANGKYFYKRQFTGTITFNNATFGDPIPGTAKAGYYHN